MAATYNLRTRDGLRAHLATHHGYDWQYVDLALLDRLDAEHRRLHEDDTAKALDHTHGEVKP